MKPTVARFVVFAPNWLGDAVMALPAIAAVRRAAPAASIAIAARPPIAPLFSMVPGIDDVVVLESKRGRESFSRALHEKDSRPLFDFFDYPLTLTPTGQATPVPPRPQ